MIIFNLGDNGFSWLTDLFIPIFIEFIAAFLGIFLGLVFSKRKENKQLFQMEDELVNELKKIKKELEAVRNKNNYIFYYITPIWEIYLASGGLSAFYELSRQKSKKAIATASKSKKIIEAYYAISYARNLEETYYLMLSKKDDRNQDLQYRKKLDELRKSELERIYKLIAQIEGSET